MLLILAAKNKGYKVDVKKLLEIDKKEDEKEQIKIRKRIHIIFSFILAATILVFKYFIEDESVIAKIFQFAGYTYGPLLGLYAFGLFTKLKVEDKLVPFVCIISPFLTYLISHLSKTELGFDFGFFILIVNGILTFLGLLSIQKQTSNE